jgi:molybdopterin-containing oxidoreductase family membrane subunit
MLSLGWSGTDRQERILGIASAILCVAVIPIAVSVHTVVSWVFGMQMQPMWHSTIFGPYFVAGAIYSGIATIILGFGNFFLPGGHLYLCPAINDRGFRSQAQG